MESFSPTAAAITVAATASSQSTLFQGNGDQMRVYNGSDSVAFWKDGGPGVIADNTCSFIAPGATEVFSIPPGTSRLAVMLESGTGNIYVQRGEGG